MNNALEFNLEFGIPARLTVSDYGHAMLSVGRGGAVVIIISDWGVSQWGSIQLNSGRCGIFPETSGDLQAATQWLTAHIACKSDSSIL